MKVLACTLVSVLLLNALPVLAADSDRLIRRANRYFAPLPASMPGSEQDSPEKIELGKKLYFDSRLSNNSLSCNSCHRLDNGFAGVGNITSTNDAKDRAGMRNSPTVLNAGLQRIQYWDGRTKGLQQQAREAFLNPMEMAMPDAQSVERTITSIKEYQQAFNQAFPGVKHPITLAHISQAIAAFERTLLTPSRFDDFLNGDAQALTQAEQQGLKTFIKADCTSCHDGVLLGGESLDTLGKKHAYSNQRDQGLYSLTGNESDRMTFKVSQLRNITLTGPYYHDGDIATLEQAVHQMAKLQLDNELSDQDVNEIISFLNTLTDKTRKQQP
ncbi:MAG: cytochrome-c peroxidase [Gammaproteobacteria bacterium]